VHNFPDARGTPKKARIPTDFTQNHRSAPPVVNARTQHNVLLIEDNPGDARLMQEYLSEPSFADFKLEHAASLKEGLERLAASGIDLVLLDLTLPDCAGLETFTRVATATPQTPIIVLSGQDDESLAMNTVHQGAQDYLVKGQGVDARIIARSMRYAMERKRAEDAIAKERDLLHTLLNNLPDRIYFKDEKSRFMRISKAVWEQFKIAGPKEAIGKTDFDFFAPEHASIALKDEQEIMRSGKPILGKVEKEILPDGSVTWAFTSKFPLKDKRGRIVGNFGISRDITEQKRAEEKLQQANNELALKQEQLQEALTELQESHEALKAAQFQLIQAEKMQSVGRLAAGVAHEVKNPLAILRMGIDYLGSNLQKPDQETTLILSDMAEALRRADAIIMGLLDFSATRALDLVAQDVGAIVEQSLALVRHEIGPAIKIMRQLTRDLPQIKLDQNKIKQVFVNLLENAIHAMPSGGTLIVRTGMKQLTADDVGHDEERRFGGQFRVGQNVVIAEVLDSGQGIPKDKLANIFDPFFTTKPAGKGTGLGLTVAKKIVELHGGELDIRNRPEGGVAATVLFKI
jgi:PAS domain S-box-containing protein